MTEEKVKQPLGMKPMTPEERIKYGVEATQDAEH